MPRKTRMYLPDVPVHVVQRGNNRDACFFCEDEYRYFLDRLSRRSRLIQRGVARLRADDRSRTSADDTARHCRYFTAHAAPWAALCSTDQPAVRAHRYAVRW
jgi:hypothetical protein